MKSPNLWRWFWIVFALSLCVRSAPMLIKQTWKPENRSMLFETDSPGYEGLGVQTLDKGWYAAQDTSRTPLYSIFIARIYALAGRNPYWIVLAQIILMSASTGLLLWLGKLLHYEWAGILAAVIWSFSPAAMIFSNLIYTEPLFTVIMLLATGVFLVCLQPETPWTAAAAPGFLFALATLTRPIGTFVPILLTIAYFLIPRISWRHAALASLLMLVSYGVTLAPRLVWMKQHTDGVMISAMYDHNFREIYDYMDYYLPSAKPFDEAHPHWMYRVGHAILKKRIDPVIQAYGPLENRTIVQNIALWEARAMDKVLRYPGVFIKMYIKGLFTLYLAPASNDFFNALNLPGHRIEFGVRSGTTYAQNMRDLTSHKSLSQILYIVLGGTFALAVYGLFMLGAWRLWHEGQKAEVLSVALPIALFTIFIGTHGTLRYREPMEPFILLIAAIEVEVLWKRLHFHSHPVRKVPYRWAAKPEVLNV